MNRPLTGELIRARTKSDNLYYVKKFTLCGNDIDDIRILRQMPNMEVLSLSVNKITSLKEFANCSRLQELYVRKNEIKDLGEIEYLAHLRDLKTLWLCENPCADHPYYREIIINALPQLQNLDKIQITPEERSAAARRDVYSREPQREAQSSPLKKNNYIDVDQESARSKHSGGRASTPGLYAKNEVYGKNDAYPSQFDESPANYQQQPQYQPQFQQQYSPYGGDQGVRDSYNSNQSPLKDYRRNVANAEPVRRSASPPPKAKNENLVSAILLLLKDVDDVGLRIIKKDVDSKLNYQ